jgi:hypothetical protein
MSYDLYFLADGPPPSRDAFLAYFQERERYAIEGDAVRRTDEASGATWSFRLTSPATVAEPGKIGPPTDAWAWFHMDTVTPDYPEVVLREVEGFARAFGSRVFNPKSGTRTPPKSGDGEAASDVDAAARFPPEGTPRTPQKKRTWFGFYTGSPRRVPHA